MDRREESENESSAGLVVSWRLPRSVLELDRQTDLEGERERERESSQGNPDEPPSFLWSSKNNEQEKHPTRLLRAQPLNSVIDNPQKSYMTRRKNKKPVINVSSVNKNHVLEIPTLNTPAFTLFGKKKKILINIY